VTLLSINPQSLGARRASKAIILLDEKARVLSVNRCLAGTSFEHLTENGHVELHQQLHPDCVGKCRFVSLWKKAWNGLSATQSIEWELDDPVTDKLLRLNLAKPPSDDNVEIDRRRRHALLTITDITKHRREYESLVKRERALLKLLREQGVDPSASANDEVAVNRSDDIRMLEKYGREFRSVSRQAMLAQEVERRRIAAELHDSIAQSAGVIKYSVEANVARLSRAYPDLDLSSLEEVIDQTKSLVDEVRRVSNNLAPSMLEDFGLCVALQAICSEFRSESCELRPTCEACVDEAELPDIVKFAVYRVVQEALNNISKHSRASHAQVIVKTVDGDLRLEVSDDGVGFDLAGEETLVDNSNVSFGLHSMRERILSAGGDFSINTAPQRGVIILATWSAEELDLLLSDETVLNSVHSNR
jgi:signal transduction histidine kinase